MSKLDFITGSLIIVSELTLFLTVVLCFFLIHQWRTKNRRKKLANEFNALFTESENGSLDNIAKLLTDKSAIREDKINEISTRLHEQQKLLASALAFAYLDKGKQPLQTVKEKLDLFVSACLELSNSQANADDNTHKDQLEQLQAEKIAMQIEMDAIKAAQSTVPAAPSDTSEDMPIQAQAATPPQMAAAVPEQNLTPDTVAAGEPDAVTSNPELQEAEPEPEIYWETENLSDDEEVSNQ